MNVRNLNIMCLVSLTIAICLSMTSAFKVTDDFQELREDGVVIGNHLNWIYVRNNAEYFMKNETAVDSYALRGSFHVREEDASPYNDSLSFQFESNNNYLSIDSADKLILTSTIANRAYFVPIPVEHCPGVFNLYVNGTEPLVTYQPRPTFTFHLQRSFPTEPAAEFYLTGNLDVEDLYKGLRTNIEITATLIHESTTSNKTTGFDKLLDLMENYNHLNGREIFFVAYYIYTDLPTYSPVFLKLPFQVQLLISGIDLEWDFIPNLEDRNTTFPLKYTFASDLHERVLPFKFSYAINTKKWAITYADTHQLNVLTTSSSTGNSQLIQSTSSSLSRIFFIDLNNDLETFRISANTTLYRPGTYVLYTPNTAPDYYFQSTYSSPGAASNFEVDEFATRLNN